MKKNDLIKTEYGIYRILSIEANRVLAIDCIKKTMPKFYPVSSFSNGEIIDCISADFPDMEDLSPTHRKVAQERYTMIASAVSVVDDIPKRNLMIEKSAELFGMSKQSIRSFLCLYLVYQDITALAPKQKHVLTAIAKDRNAVGITSSDFIRRHNLVSASSVQAAMKPLLKNEIVINEDGKYRIYDYFFADYLARMY